MKHNEIWGQFIDDGEKELEMYPEWEDIEKILNELHSPALKETKT